MHNFSNPIVLCSHPQLDYRHELLRAYYVVLGMEQGFMHDRQTFRQLSITSSFPTFFLRQGLSREPCLRLKIRATMPSPSLLKVKSLIPPKWGWHGVKSFTHCWRHQ